MSDRTPTNWKTLQEIFARTPPGQVLQLVAKGDWIGCYRTPDEIDLYHLPPAERDQFFVASFLTLAVEASRFSRTSPGSSTLDDGV